MLALTALVAVAFASPLFAENADNKEKVDRD
jgi:hypothetical protein